jgi:hypothetical protein
VFHDRVLSEWELTRNFAAGGRVPIPDVGSVPALSKSAYAAAQQSEVPKK